MSWILNYPHSDPRIPGIGQMRIPGGFNKYGANNIGSFRIVWGLFSLGNGVFSSFLGGMLGSRGPALGPHGIDGRYNLEVGTSSPHKCKPRGLARYRQAYEVCRTCPAHTLRAERASLAPEGVKRSKKARKSRFSGPVRSCSRPGAPSYSWGPIRCAIF